MRPLNDYYYGELLRPERETASGIVIPDEALPDSTDLLVSGAGPGRVLPEGNLSPMQAAPGDRVVVRYPHFTPCGEAGWGFVTDADLVAIIPGPHHDELLPAGDWVKIAPDRLYHVDPATGATVQQKGNGVLMASVAAMGGTGQVRREAELAYAEWGRIAAGPEYRDQPTEYDRHRMMHRWLDGLRSDVRVELGNVIQQRGESKWKRYKQWVRKERPTRGKILAAGPGRILLDGRRLDPWPFWVADPRNEKAPFHPVGFDALPGQAVHWQPECIAVALFDGERYVLLVRAGDLNAVEVEEAVAA